MPDRKPVLLRRTIRSLVLVLGGLLSLATVLGLFGQSFWLLDVLAYGRLQYAVLLLVVFVTGLFVLRPRQRAFWMLPALLVNGFFLAPYFLPRSTPEMADGAPLKVVAVNINAHNERIDPLAEYLRAADAEVVVVIEATESQRDRLLAALPGSYPHFVDAAQRGHFGMLLLSRLPLATSTVHRLGERGYPSIEATVEWQGTVVTLFGVHPHPPLGERGTQRRDNEMAEMNGVVAEIEGPLVVLGDLNAAPWTYTVTRLSEAAGLRNAALGHGIWPTWWLGNRSLGLPYDHILVSDAWDVASFRLGPEIGSDHLPVEAELFLSP